MSFYIGKYEQDSQDHRGWIVGTFIEKTDPRKTDAVEVKYWKFNAGPTDHATKISNTFECTLILAGCCKAIIGDEEHKLSSGEYVAIKPGTPNNIVQYAYETTVGLTIKAPSDPSAKKEI